MCIASVAVRYLEGIVLQAWLRCTTYVNSFDSAVAYSMTACEDDSSTWHVYLQLVTVTAAMNCLPLRSACKQNIASGIVKKRRERSKGCSSLVVGF